MNTTRNTKLANRIISEFVAANALDAYVYGERAVPNAAELVEHFNRIDKIAAELGVSTYKREIPFPATDERIFNFLNYKRATMGHSYSNADNTTQMYVRWNGNYGGQSFITVLQNGLEYLEEEIIYGRNDFPNEVRVNAFVEKMKTKYHLRGSSGTAGTE